MKGCEVKNITYNDCKEWLLFKHYAHRVPSISYAFGLYISGKMVGVITFGMPASPSLIKGLFGGLYMNSILELNRLCVNDGLPKNTLSWFVGQSLKMLPKPMAIVSYADMAYNHHGYIYQATNWIYTGLSSKHKEYIISGAENKHSRHINDVGGVKMKIEDIKELYGDKIIESERSRKHRYVYLLGSKTQRRKMKANLKYSQCPYPKGENKRYDASYVPNVQLTIF